MLLTALRIGFEEYPNVDSLASPFELPTPLTPQELDALTKETVEPPFCDESSFHPAVTRLEMGQDYRAQIRREHLEAQNAPEQATSKAEAAAPFVGPMALLAAATFVSDREWAERLAENRRRASRPFLAPEVRKAALAAIPWHLR